MDAILQRFKSKTYWAALILAALTIIEANAGVVAFLVPLAYQPYTPLIFPLVMMAMREVTKTALDEKC